MSNEHRIRFRLPAPYKHLAGRDSDLEELRRLFAEHPLLILRGTPGIGKTQLAAHLAAQAETPMVAWIRGGEPGLAADAQALLRGLSISSADASAGDDPLQTLSDHLARLDEWTLVIDAAPDQQPPVLLLTLPTGSRRIIVTTNNKSWHEPGIVYDVRELEECAAAAFLVERAAVRDSDTQDAAEELSRKLHGLPLALRQCEGWTHSAKSTLPRYLEMFEARTQELLRVGPGPFDHQQTVSVTFDLALASAEERRPGSRQLLQTLACFSEDPFPRSWVLSTDSNPLDADEQLRSLTTAGLLDLTPTEITLHGLVATAVRTATLRSVAVDTLIRARSWLQSQLTGDPHDSAAWPDHSEAVSHLEALGERLIDAGLDDGESIELLDRLATFHEVQGRLARARKYFEVALSASVTSPDEDLRATVEGNLAHVVARIDRNEGIPMLEQVVAERRRRAEQHPRGLADALNNLGLAVSSRDAALSARCQDEALRIYSRITPEIEWPEHEEILHGLVNRGLAAWRGGDLAGAERDWQEVLKLANAASSDRSSEIATALSNLGVLYDNRGDGPNAAKYGKEGYELTVQLLGERHPDSVLRLVNFGGALRVLGETQGAEYTETALRYHRQAEQLAREMDPLDPGLLALALNNQGVDLIRLGDPIAAMDPLEAALKLREQAAGGKPDADVAQSLGNIAKALLDARSYAEAARRYQQVLEYCDRLGLSPEHDRRGLAWDGLGEVASREGKHDQAAELFEESYRAFGGTSGGETQRAATARQKREREQQAAADEQQPSR
jgi:tetratricopeptide (TPR) repeat protein